MVQGTHFFAPLSRTKITSTGLWFPPGDISLLRGSGELTVPSEFSPATATSPATPFLAVVLGLASAEAGYQWIRELEAGLSAASEAV